MIRTELDLPTDVYHDAEQMAKERHTPTAQVLREIISLGTEAWRLRSGKRQSHGLGQLAKLRLKGPEDLATNLDDYLYGDKT